jgi:hypothetical protein
MRYGCLKITKCSEDSIKIEKHGITWDNGDTWDIGNTWDNGDRWDNATWNSS